MPAELQQQTSSVPNRHFKSQLRDILSQGDQFEPGLMSDDPPDWISSYSEFTSEIKRNFGPHDPEGDAENKLEALRMKDNQRMVKYLVDFSKSRPFVMARIQNSDSLPPFGNAVVYCFQ